MTAATVRSKVILFTCVALAKVGPLRPAVRPSVLNTLGCQVRVICYSKSFHSFLLKLCLMIVHISKMCTFYFVHVSYFFFSFLTGVELRHFFSSEMIRGCLPCVICNSSSIHSFIFKLNIMIVHT